MIDPIKLAQLFADIKQQGDLIKHFFTELFDRINKHLRATGNVHNMEPKDIGLDRVQNYGPATAPQAKQGTNNSSLMTPKRTDDWARKNVYGALGTALQESIDRLQ